MTAILRDAPAPLTSILNGPLPLSLIRIVERCLEKSPAARFQSTTNLSFALRALSKSDATGVDAIAARRPFRTERARVRMAWALSLVALLVAGVVGIWRPWRAAPVQRFAWPVGDAELYLSAHPLALSPDGRLVVYAARPRNGIPGSPQTLYVRRIGADQLDAVPIPDTTAASDPFFSPDSHWIGFVSHMHGELRKSRSMAAPRRPSTQRRLCAVRHGTGGGFLQRSWRPVAASPRAGHQHDSERGTPSRGSSF